MRYNDSASCHCHLTFWLGLFSIGGVLFIWHPVEIPALLLMDEIHSRQAGN